ncbi:hypothetical protein Btru_045016 [Bulinus truncatus]|nr:hypothetical protein Btru_045016 [Bulinus truncatus]
MRITQVQPSPSMNYHPPVTRQPIISTRQVGGTPYRDYMTAAILVTLCCFWPTGILAILRASDVEITKLLGYEL